VVVFGPDLDPTTTTNPRTADTDGDGVSGGDEDLNHNGKVGENENEPNIQDDLSEIEVNAMDTFIAAR
jgi:hypothetical protein